MRGRYAPSPTGRLHLGNARTALLAWLDARSRGGTFVMPVMNGAEFLKVVKRTPSLASIPRVIMTAANDPMIGIKEDVTVLYKPVDFDALTRLLQVYCGSYAARAQ